MIPIACTLTPDELRDGARELLPGLAADAARIAPLADGVRLAFATDGAIVTRIGEVIDRERRCCRFLAFTLRVPSDDGLIELDVTGPTGVAELLASLDPRLAVAAP